MDKILLISLTVVVMHNSMQLESMFDNKNKGQKNERKKCPPFANKKPKYIMCHASLDGGMNCVGYDKFPVLSNGIKKKKKKKRKKEKKPQKEPCFTVTFQKQFATVQQILQRNYMVFRKMNSYNRQAYLLIQLRPMNSFCLFHKMEKKEHFKGKHSEYYNIAVQK